MGCLPSRNTQGWELAVVPMHLTDAGKGLFGRDELVRIVRAPCGCHHAYYAQAIHQMHQDIISGVPEGFQNLAASPRCAVQGLLLPGRVLSVQGHPEFNEEITTEIIKMRHAQKVLSDELATKGLKDATSHHDGIFIAAAMWKFLISS